MVYGETGWLHAGEHFLRIKSLLKRLGPRREIGALQRRSDSMARRVELSMLQQLADDAAADVLENLGISVECAYLGQVSGPETNRVYTKDPLDWAIEKGSKPGLQTIAFEWRVDECTYVVDQLCKNARQRGMRRPTELSRVDLPTLQQLAVAGVLEDLGICVDCAYLGQVTGPDSSRSCAKDPPDWAIEKGSKPQKTNRCFCAAY